VSMKLIEKKRFVVITALMLLVTLLSQSVSALVTETGKTDTQPIGLSEASEEGVFLPRSESEHPVEGTSEGSSNDKEFSVADDESESYRANASLNEGLGVLQNNTEIIALIDTGVSENVNVIDRVSVIGSDVGDENGHGDRMLSEILGINPHAAVVSVKALDENGKGSSTDVYKAIKYAVSRGDITIINLSLSAFAGENSELIKAAVEEAANSGITVIAAAGNDGGDAMYYIPASIESAVVVGACDENGNKNDSSNYGSTVDYNVFADTTSQAAARLSGFVSANGAGAISEQVNKGLIFNADHISDGSRSDNNDESFHAAATYTGTSGGCKWKIDSA